ncbi:glycosyltransferase family 39 protein [Oscillatoria sp. FACHB-1407]|uniref:ArnT family glycosyltransferase n=1 Tax=Oscillatoria sp. FACHB-1407 TaxID=2692847 RepID=UPI001683F3C7|nr:glycosyltransferase family 39 protein [Oscillatoria sp. FACHB-1407]MBD2460146.1 glycosyltransferase family 39 protein [Oscillatoria sp. FACHB-1407]
MKSPTHLFDSLLRSFEKRPSRLWLFSVGWVGLVCGIAFLWRLGSTGLVDETEPLFAEAARQMTVTGDWITPYFNNATRFDKPPLVYWFMAIAYHIIGVNEWAVRLPSALSAIALTVFGWLTLQRFAVLPQSSNEGGMSRLQPHHQRWLAAWIGAVLMAFNLQTILWARTGVSDMLLSGCIGTAMLAFFWGYTEPTDSPAKPRWYLACYVLLALAVLTKGPIGVVLPGLAIALFLLYVGQFRAVLRELRLWQGALIFLGLTLPWYILVTLANGDAFIDSFFGYHNFQRFTRAVNNHTAPWFFYFGVVLVGFAPWSLYLPSAIARLRFWRPALWRNQPRTAHLSVFALSWFVAVFGFFTIAETKLPSYVLPLIPAAAMLVAVLWSEEVERSRLSRGVWISSLFSVGFLAILAVVIAISPRWLSGDPAMPNFPEIVQQSGILTGGAVIVAIAALLQLVALLLRQGRWGWLIHTVAIGVFILFTAMPFMTLIDAQRQLPLRQLAATALQQQQPTEQLIMVGFPKPSLVFYTQLPITYVVHTEDLAPWLRRPFRFRRNAPTSVMVLGLPRKLQELNLKPGEFTTLQRSGAYELIRVKQPLE